MAKRAYRILPALALLTVCLLLTGCEKNMTDDQFAAVATTMYENVRANWDHQAGEPWEQYLERRIGEACAQNKVSVRQWDKKMRDVRANPDKYGKLIEPETLAEIIKWQGDRLRAKGQE